MLPADWRRQVKHVPEAAEVETRDSAQTRAAASWVREVASREPEWV